MNLYRQFQTLLPLEPLLLGTVEAHQDDGTSTITLLGGGTLKVSGVSVAIGAKAFIQGGRIVGPAPDLPGEIIEV